MSKKTYRWSLRETIQQFERSHKNSCHYFTRTNKVLIFGRAETELEQHHSAGPEVFYSVTLEVRRSQIEIDHVPVLISRNIIKSANLPNPLKGNYIEVIGQLRAYDLIIDGYRQTPMFVFAKCVSLFTIRKKIENKMGENAVFLEGYVSEHPIVQFILGDKHVTELVLTVSGRFNRIHLIPCVMNGEYAKLATLLRRGDYMAFYGRIENKKQTSYNNSIYMCDYCTTHQVSVLDVQSSPMFSRAKF